MVRECVKLIIKFHNNYQEITGEIFKTCVDTILSVINKEYNNEMCDKIAFYGKIESEDFLLQTSFIDRTREYRSVKVDIETDKYAIGKKSCLFEEAFKVNNSIRINIRYNMRI